MDPSTSQPIIASPKSAGEPSPTDLEDVATLHFIQTDPSGENQHFVAEEIDPSELLNVEPSQSQALISSSKIITNNTDSNADDIPKLSFDKYKKYTTFINNDFIVPEIIFENDDPKQQEVDDPDPLVSGGIKLDIGLSNNNNHTLVKKKTKENPGNDMALATVSPNHKSLERLNSKYVINTSKFFSLIKKFSPY